MNKFLIILLLALTACTHTNNAVSAKGPVASYVSVIPSRGIDYDKNLNRIAFGSCANQDEPQPIWKDILSAKPDLFLFMGDNVYASTPDQQPIAEQYRKLDLIPNYLEARRNIPFMATWDDHDFGLKDGGADWVGKDSARRDFMNYWSYIRNTIPVEQQGVYHSKMIGTKKKMVQIIMLDTRYFRSPLVEIKNDKGFPAGYVPQTTGTILGEGQWQWLEQQLRRPADLRFIVSSIQVIAEEPKFEKWGNFPKERQRLFDLIKKSKAKNVVLLSGDRHIGSISKVDLKDYGPLYEVTASSLNRGNNYPDSDSHYIGPVYNGENFGFAQIDWSKKNLSLEIRGLDSKMINSVNVKLR